MTDLLYGIDVSNWQGEDIRPLLSTHKPDHVTVRLSTESGSHIAIARDQLRHSLEFGATVDGYGWAYWWENPNSCVDDWIQVGRGHGLPDDGFIWIDCEDHNGAHVDRCINWLASAVAQVEARGYKAGIYTGQPFWFRYVGNSPDFGRLPLWMAYYDESPHLGVDDARFWPFGGWSTLAGKQWTQSVVDRSVWDAAVLRPQAQPPVEPPHDPLADLRAQVAAMEGRLQTAEGTLERLRQALVGG